MEPTNKAERKKAYINFMLLFLLCSGIIITTVFFSTRVPLKQNEELVDFQKSVNEKSKLNNDFTGKMIAVSGMIDSLDLKKPNELTLFDNTIDEKIKDLSNIFPGEENDENRLYKNIIKNLTYYHAAKKAVRETSDKNATDKDMADKIKKAEDKAQDLFNQLIDCKTGKH